MQSPKPKHEQRCANGRPAAEDQENTNNRHQVIDEIADVEQQWVHPADGVIQRKRGVSTRPIIAHGRFAKPEHRWNLVETSPTIVSDEQWEVVKDPLSREGGKVPHNAEQKYEEEKDYPPTGSRYVAGGVPI